MDLGRSDKSKQQELARGGEGKRERERGGEKRKEEDGGV